MLKRLNYYLRNKSRRALKNCDAIQMAEHSNEI